MTNAWGGSLDGILIGATASSGTKDTWRALPATPNMDAA